MESQERKKRLCLAEAMPDTFKRKGSSACSHISRHFRACQQLSALANSQEVVHWLDNEEGPRSMTERRMPSLDKPPFNEHGQDGSSFFNRHGRHLSSGRPGRPGRQPRLRTWLGLRWTAVWLGAKGVHFLQMLSSVHAWAFCY